MGEQNLILKRKLVIQSFLPLFILILSDTLITG